MQSNAPQNGVTKMKRAICCRCGKDLRHNIPDDAEEVTCFECCEKENKRRDHIAKAEADPPYLAQLIAEMMETHPTLTREKAREMLLESGA